MAAGRRPLSPGHIEESVRIGWATVNKRTGGARGRKKSTKKSARKSPR